MKIHPKDSTASINTGPEQAMLASSKDKKHMQFSSAEDIPRKIQALHTMDCELHPIKKDYKQFYKRFIKFTTYGV